MSVGQIGREQFDAAEHVTQLEQVREATRQLYAFRDRAFTAEALGIREEILWLAVVTGSVVAARFRGTTYFAAPRANP